ncbi:MAG: transcriptional regulator [Planctomycetota bacterium]|jgi:predicted  nucleic acid-binding Zn-ribbon protein
MQQDHEFQAKLGELSSQIDRLPLEERERLQKLLDETKTRHTRLRGMVTQLQESLDHLRLSVKYLVFDLEATRRENAYLRKMLRDTPEEGHEQEGAD